MKNFYDPKNIIKREKGNDQDEPYGGMVDFKDDGVFHIGQVYEDVPASTLVCKYCGGNQFNVGQGNYFTAIRCVNCEYETSIHTG